MKKVTTIVILVLVGCFVGINFLFQPSQLNYINSSTIGGLATMRKMAQETIAYQDAIVNSRPTLVEFYADWCTTCQSMSPTLKELKQTYQNDVNFVMVNIDEPENQLLVQEYKVSGVPQWNILDTQGHNVRQLIGKLPKSILESNLVEVNS